MKIAVDYVTLRLTETFGWPEFVKWVERERLDPETGEILPPIIQANQFRVKTMLDKTVVVSFYRGAEPEAIKLSRKYHLPVTRVDICIDQRFDSPEKCREVYDTYIDDITAWIEMQPSQPSHYNFDGKATSANGEYGYVLFSRQSIKQLRVYAKREEKLEGSDKGAQSLRLEWQLHGDLAKEVWPLVTKNYPLNKEVLYDLHQNITAKYLLDDMFNLGPFNKREIQLEKNLNIDGGFEQWCLVTIPKALVRHFKTTGIDYSHQIVEQFQALLKAEAAKTEGFIKTKEQAAIAATYHKLKGKLQ
jgi:hypothetical protein